MILDFNQFVNEQALVQKERQLMLNIFKQFEELSPVMNEAQLLVETGCFDGMLEELNEESIIQKAKAKFDRAVEVAKEKGKKALSDTQEKIIKLGGNIANVIKMIVAKLKEWIEALFAQAKSVYSSAAQKQSAEISKQVEGKSKEYRNKLLKEIGNFKTMAKAVTGWATSGFVKQTSDAAATAAKQDEAYVFEHIMLDTINEAVITGQLDFRELLEGEGGIPFVSAIAHKMHDIPPFSLLDKVKKAAEKVAGGMLNKVSYYATEIAGAPGPFEFAALATLIGIVSEVKVKGITKHAILHAIPGLGTIATIISTVAMGLAVVAVVETLVKGEA